MADLLPASYSRGGKTARFFVSTISMGFGRRGKLHQTPFNDTPFFEDLGRQGKVFTVECYIMPTEIRSESNAASLTIEESIRPDNRKGADYRGQRDLLIEVIESSTGTGVFVHPTMGTLNVVPTLASTKFDNKQGRIETFSITFVEEGNRAEKQADTRQKVVDENAKYSNFILADFNLRYPVEGHTFLLKGKEPIKPLQDSWLSKLNDKMKGWLKKVDGLAKATKMTDASSDFASDFLEIANTLQSFPQLIIGSITEVYAAVNKIMTGLSVATQNPFDRLMNAIGLFGSMFEDSKAVTAKYNSLKGNKNSQAFRAAEADDGLLTLHLNVALEEIANAVVLTDFESVTQIQDVQAQINQAYTNMALKVGDSDYPVLYDSIIALQATINEDLNSRVEQLPDVKVIQNKRIRSALVIAYNQHGDTEKAFDLISRNEINDPNSTPIGDLEVLV
ncbi:hypothetical protein CL634_09575 [bacterium]|nr:hypothetical protein [bacterium]